MNLVPRFHNNRFQERRRNAHSFPDKLINVFIVDRIIDMIDQIRIFMKIQWNIYQVIIPDLFFLFKNAVESKKLKVIQGNRDHRVRKLKWENK